MMNRTFTLATSIACLLFASVSQAQDFKAAYVDLQRALLEVDEGRAAKAKLQKMLDDKQKELDRQQEALRKEKELLDKQAAAMSEETRLQRQTELQQKLFALAQKWENGQKDMAVTERNELQAIFAKMDPIIAEIAAREGITMVFEKTDSGLVYAPSSLDLTNELVRLYNARNKGAKPAAGTSTGGKGGGKSQAPAKKN